MTRGPLPVAVGLLALLGAIFISEGGHAQRPEAAPADTVPADTVPEPSRQYPPVGRDIATSLDYPPLEFDAPEVEFRTVDPGVDVLFMEDHSLPIVDFYARFRGGYALFDRRYYAAGTAVPTLLRTGGTRTLAPDSVDRLMEFYAFQTTFGSGGESAFSSINTLTEHVDAAARLWGEMLRQPRFDSTAIEVWRGKTLESVRRRADDPTGMAFSEFNRLVFGDHPTGWEMQPADLGPENVSRERLAWIHERVYCPENMILGVAGDIEWDRAEELLEGLLDDWPSCSEDLPEAREAEPRRDGGVFVIQRQLSQSTVVMAEPGGVRRSARGEYYASRIANSILGASGFTSRLMSRVRSDAGLAYSVSSLWTTPADSEGIVGAVTQTRASSTVEATRMILDVFREMTRAPPDEEEVRTAIDEIVNGFVFNFEEPGQIVSRQMFYQIQELPQDWLERYVEGIQRVRPDDVQRVMREHVDPERMTILILGDTARFDLPADSLGEVRYLDAETGEISASSRRGSRRSPGSGSSTPPPESPRSPDAVPAPAAPETPSPTREDTGTPRDAPRRSGPPGEGSG